ncbi:MAG: nicotinate phosphoribosyltransferase [Candidatus Spechtbacterales bacterium]|nr:nicotinate phosphoribosyltransferase [Candidatus Spechtbacterales bacterium]
MPIIESLLDTDFYKFTMGQFVFHRYPNIPVRYTFKCRNKGVKLGNAIPEKRLREELDAVRELRLTTEEATQLREQQYYPGLFKDNYIKFLRGLRLPEYNLEYRNGKIHLEFFGPWKEAIYWETFALSIINELYYKETVDRYKYKHDIHHDGWVRLNPKIQILRANPGIKIIDFGTRRRFSRDWQEIVVRVLRNQVPENIIGTSNVFLAFKYGMQPMGTFAHEIPMVISAIWRERTNDWDSAILLSHNAMLLDWWNEYGETLSIALTDTYGSEFFFRDMSRSQADMWRGLRHDSGDPVDFGERAIKFYNSYGIDPREKTIVFSNALKIDEITMLSKRFGGRIMTPYGWGTNLTNDVGLDTLSIVVKATKAFEYGTVKLSDNLAKATGSRPDQKRFKEIFGYTNTDYEETVV